MTSRNEAHPSPSERWNCDWCWCREYARIDARDVRCINCKRVSSFPTSASLSAPPDVVEHEADQLMLSFYVGPDYDPNARPADNLKAAIAFTLRSRAAIEAADEITRLRAREVKMREALQHAVAIIEQHVPQDALGMNGDPRDGMWPLRDEYLHHMRQALGDTQ